MKTANTTGVQSDLQLYMREVDQIPLLTALQERQLGWRIINDNDMQAKELMIRANLRLVIARLPSASWQPEPKTANSL